MHKMQHGNAGGLPRFRFTPRTSHSGNSRQADEDRECDSFLNHGLRGGGLILLHFLRETGKSGEDEHCGDCESFDGLLHGFVPFVNGFVIRLTPRIRTRPAKVTRNF